MSRCVLEVQTLFTAIKDDSTSVMTGIAKCGVD